MSASAAVGLGGLVADLARGLGQRLVQLVRAADRIDSLEGHAGPLTSEELADDPGAREAVAREMVGRMLRAAADPRAGAVLRRIALAGEPQRAAALAEAEGVTRLVLSRVLDDLSDAGLVGRDLASDTVAATAPGTAVLRLLDELERATADEVAARLGRDG